MTNNIDFQLLGIATVFKRFRLRVPPNQREYSWEQEEVLDLLQDVQKAMRRPTDTYFLGTIVLTTTGPEDREVADGQQRLATTAILLATIRDWFAEKNDRMMVESIDNELLSKIDRDAGERVPRLTLNTDDNEFFKSCILDHREEQTHLRPTRRSHRLLSQAKQVIAAHFKHLEAQAGTPNFREILKEWINYLEDKATVVTLSVGDSNNAFTMFETLNDRGLKTSQADLVKNYLFKESKDRLPEAQSHWSCMRGAIETVGEEDLTMEYLRLACCVQTGATRERDVMDRISELAKNRTEALRQLHLLNELASDYAAILNPDHVKWASYPDDVRKAVSTINYLGITQIRPLMLAVARHFKPQRAAKAMRRMVAWSVRFLIVGGRGGKLDEGYAKLAHEIHVGGIKTPSDLASRAENFVPSDGQFRGAFETARVSVSRLARYYLRALETAERDEPDPEWIPNEDVVINLEHVMPEAHSQSWPEVSPQDVETHGKRIGNMVLLQAHKNSEIGNDAFDVKRVVYRQSTFRLTQQVGKEKTWNVAAIEQRQKLLAALAVKTWPLD